MKNVFAILMAMCMLRGLLCITAFATEPAAGVVLRVSALKEGDTPEYESIGDYDSFEDGWNAAMELADSDAMETNNYDRVVVDLYDDWTAVDGQFTEAFRNGSGFDWDAIYVQDGVRITLNMNGHTINRGLTEWENNGEVMCIDEDADVIIHDGTIKGGWSCNGAGGIHIKDNANVVLDNVNIMDNKVDDDDGAGIAVYDGAVLTMNGGSVSYNASYNAVYGGGVYVENASAFFTDVTFQDNRGFHRSTHGAAVYVDNGTLKMENCQILGNGLMQESDGDASRPAYSVINLSNGSDATITGTEFFENGDAYETYTENNTMKYTTVINTIASQLTMEKCTFHDNHQVYLIQSEASILNAVHSDFTGNHSFVFYGNCARGRDSAFTNCTFDYSEPMLNLEDTFFFNLSDAGLSFVDCVFGDATFNEKDAAQFIDTEEPDGSNYPASIFGEGSLAMIIVILALIAISICIIVAYRKKAVHANVEDKE